MILVDADVLIDYDRTADPKLFTLFHTRPVAVCGVTRAELLHGARSAAHRGRLLGVLAMFTPVPIPDSLWDQVGDHLAALRANGLTLPFADVVVASVAIATGAELWTRDHHFTAIRGVLPALRLFAEPP